LLFNPIVSGCVILSKSHDFGNQLIKRPIDVLLLFETYEALEGVLDDWLGNLQLDSTFWFALFFTIIAAFVGG
jgi:hypothetical protein